MQAKSANKGSPNSVDLKFQILPKRFIRNFKPVLTREYNSIG